MKCIKTEAGQVAFKTRSPLMSARQRGAFLQFDGLKTNEAILATTTAFGVTQADLDHLLAQGFLVAVEVAVADSEVPTLPGPLSEPATPLHAQDHSHQERYREAMLIATKLTAGLGLRGFRLNLAIEGAAGYDDLLALLPKIKEAVGSKQCKELERALTG